MPWLWPVPHPFAEFLELGKYARWAQSLDNESRDALLYVFGEFGFRYAALRGADGYLPAPQFAAHNMSEARMIAALERIAEFCSPGSGDLRRSTFPLRPRVAVACPAFMGEDRERLRGYPGTAWAAELCLQEYKNLIWLVGEYGVRVNSESRYQGAPYPQPRFAVPPRQERLMRAALELLARIERHEVTTVRDVEAALTLAEAGPAG